MTMARRSRRRPKNTPAHPLAQPPLANRLRSWEGKAAIAAPYFYLLVLCSCLASFPRLMSGNFLPKTLAASITLALGFLFLPPRRPPRLRLSLLGALWTAYAAWALASVLWAPQDRVVVERFASLMIPTLAYILARRTRFWLSDGFWDRFCILLGLVAAIGMAQINPAGLVPAPIHQAASWFTGTAVPRATLGHRNYASLFFLLAAPFLAWRFYAARTPWRAALALVVFAADLVFILYARTRSVWVALVLAATALLAAGAIPKMRQRRRRTAILAGGAAIAFLFAAVNSAEFLKGMGSKRSIPQTAAALSDPSNRLPMWTATFGITNPLIGGGFGNFPIHATPQSPDSKVKTLNWEVHNDYLQAYLDLGIVGCALFIGFFAVAAANAWRHRRQGIVLAAGAALVAFCCVQFFTFIAEKISAQLMIAGALAIIQGQGRARHIVSKPMPRVLAVAAGPLLAILLCLFAFGVWKSIRGDYLFRQTNAMMNRLSSLDKTLRQADKHSPEELARARGELRELARRFHQRLNRLARTVLPSMPFDANMRHITAHMFAGNALLARNPPVAEAFAHHALELHPNDHTAMGVLASVASERGQRQQARQWLEKAVAIKKPDSGMRLEVFLARLRLEQGEPQAAIDLLENSLGRIQELDNPYSQALQALVKIYSQTGNAARARELTERSEANRVEKPAITAPRMYARIVAQPGQDKIAVPFRWTSSPGAEKYVLRVHRAGKDTWKNVLTLETRDGGTTVALPVLPEEFYYNSRVDALGKYRTERSDTNHLYVRKDGNLQNVAP